MALIGDMVDSATDETFRQIKPFDGPVKLLYQKKGGKAKVLAKVQAWFATRYRPRVQRVFRRLLAEEGQGEEAGPSAAALELAEGSDASPAVARHATMKRQQTRSQRMAEDLETVVQPLCCFGAGCWDLAVGPVYLAPKDHEMTAVREPGSTDGDAEYGGDDADADADVDAAARADMADISEAYARAVERSVAAQGIARVQAAWRGKKVRH